MLCNNTTQTITVTDDFSTTTKIIQSSIVSFWYIGNAGRLGVLMIMCGATLAKQITGHPISSPLHWRCNILIDKKPQTLDL